LAKSPNVIYKSEFIPTQKDILTNPLKYGDYATKRKFYTSQNKSNDYVNYINTGKPAGKFTDYLGYTTNKEKSAGAFNSNGLLSKEELADLKDKLKQTESPIWNGIISFSSEFGNLYMEDTNKAIELLKRTMPMFLTNAKFDVENVEWYAGLHENTENKHIHISFFEKEKTRFRANKKGLHFSNGMISKFAMDKFKLDIELKLLDMQTYLYRDNLISTFKTEREQNQYFLKNDLLKLARYLPKGRTSYNSQNMRPYKFMVDKIVRKIFKNSPECQKYLLTFENKIKEVNAEIKKMCGRNKSRYEKYAVDNKYMESLWSKFGNDIIRTAKTLNEHQKAIDENIGKTLKDRRIKKQHRQFQLDYLAKFNEYCDNQAIQSFQNYLDKLEYNRIQIEKELSSKDYYM